MSAYDFQNKLALHKSDVKLQKKEKITQVEKNFEQLVAVVKNQN